MLISILTAFNGKQIPVEEIPLKKGGPLKEKDILEDKKRKEVRTYAEVVSERITGTRTNTQDKDRNNAYDNNESNSSPIRG